jgi:hypothetical protein
MSSVRAFDAPADVTVIRWPAEATARTLLVKEGRPRVLVVAPEATAPPPIDDLEDWLRDPVDPVELVARTEALRRHVTARAVVPWLDDDGLLHVGDRWVSISDAQLPMIRLLLDRFGQLVRTEELVAAYTAAGGTDNPTSIRTAIVRARARVASVGLDLRGARQRGVVLELASNEEG